MHMFVIVSTQRTGSHLLRGLLNSHPEAKVFGELMHPDAEVRKQKITNLGLVDPFDPEKELPGQYLDSVFLVPNSSLNTGAIGFKLMRDPWLPAELLSRWDLIREFICANGFHVIHSVRKNLLDRHISARLARDSNYWIRPTGFTLGSDDEPPRTRSYLGKARLDPVQVKIDIEASINTIGKIRSSFCENPYLEIEYEELVSDTRTVMARICNFLRLDVLPLTADTIKQRGGSQSEWVENYDEVSNFLKEEGYSEYLNDDCRDVSVEYVMF